AGPNGRSAPRCGFPAARLCWSGGHPRTPGASGTTSREGGLVSELRSAVVVGTGLIGTSIALALREQDVQEWLADRDPASARLAADIGAGALAGEGVAGFAPHEGLRAHYLTPDTRLRGINHTTATSAR